MQKDWIGDILGDYLAMAMTGLGITFLPYSEYVGGLFLAIACAAWAPHFSPEKSRKEFWAVIWGGIIAAHLAVIAANVWFPEWKPQLVMAVAGFFSRFLARFTMRLTNQLEDSAEDIGETVATKIKKTIN